MKKTKKQKKTHFIRKASMRMRLFVRKVKALARVGDGFDFEIELFGELEHGADAREQRRGAARLDEQLLRVDKERRLAQHVRVKVLVVSRREDRARHKIAHAIPVGARHSPQQAVRRTRRIRRMSNLRVSVVRRRWQRAGARAVSCLAFNTVRCIGRVAEIGL